MKELRELMEDALCVTTGWSLTLTPREAIATHPASGISIVLTCYTGSDGVSYEGTIRGSRRVLAKRPDMLFLRQGLKYSTCVKRLRRYIAECEYYISTAMIVEAETAEREAWAKNLSERLSRKYSTPGKIAPPVTVTYHSNTGNYTAYIREFTIHTVLRIADDLREALTSIPE